jgi:hypothetical protein
MCWSGVLTKPDRIPPGGEEEWLKILRNETEPLDNNWYCVKQPNPKTLAAGISWAEARKQENDFFSMTSPWSTLDPFHQKYLRTSNLTDRLSTILSDLISRRSGFTSWSLSCFWTRFHSLPEIQEELQKLLQETEEGLSGLPTPPSEDAFSQVMHLLTTFMRDLSHHIKGVPDESGLLQTIRPVQEEFRRAIQATAPNFRPYEKRFSSRDPPQRPQFLSNEEYEEEVETEEIGENTEQHSKNKSAIVTRVPIYVDEVLDRALR